MVEIAHIAPELLSRYAAEGLPADAHRDLKHLAKCATCAELYVQLTMKSASLRVAAPEGLWSGIQTHLHQPSSSSPRLGFAGPWGFVLTSSLALILVAFLAVERWSLRRAVPRVDVGQYIAVLEKTSAAPSAANLRQTFSASVAYDRDAALRETGMRAQAQGYGLAEQRVLHAGRANIIQLVYGTPQDAAVVIVAPRAATLSLGNYHLVAADIAGLHCKRVQCPRQDIFWSTLRQHQYVFIRRRNSATDSGRLFADLVGARDQTAGQPTLWRRLIGSSARKP